MSSKLRMISIISIMALLPLVSFALPGFRFRTGAVFAAEKKGGESAKRAAAVGSAHSTAPAPGTVKGYLGKDYIDSTVLRAIYLINDAAGAAGVGFRRKESLVEARGIAGRLKNECKGDPNERYALWKINELEWLILLEEKDIVLEQMNRGQLTANQLIADYNAEVARQRPDFRKLSRLHSRIAEVSPSQADAMASSMAKRSKAVSRESMVALEKALMYNNSALANETFRYCLGNRAYLAFSDAKFEQLEARMSAFSRSREEFPEVKKEADRVRQLLDQNRIGEARSILVNANFRLNDIRSYVPVDDANRMAFNLMRLEGALGRCEDSLVQVNLAVLKTDGVIAANQYLQSVLRTAGVSNEKMARVDQAILSVTMPASENSALQKEIGAVARSAEEGGIDVIGDMRAMAVKKARQKQDSADAAAARIAEQEARKNQVHAKRVAAEIYGLIERNKPRVAYDFFDSKRPFLQNNLTQDAFAMLEGSVKQVVDPKWEAEYSDEIAYLAPVASQQKTAAEIPAATAKTSDANSVKAMEIIAKVYEALERNQVKSAYQRFEREKLFLKANLNQDAYAILSETVSSAYQKAR